MVLSTTLLRITAHATPHQSDPPDAREFYAALGMFVVAWCRLEGHLTGNLLTIMNFPELADGLVPLPLRWDKRFDLWKRAFDKVPALQPYKLRAVAFMKSLVAEAEDRNFAAHAIWDEFIADATEPTIGASDQKKARRKQSRWPTIAFLCRFSNVVLQQPIASTLS
jgi:hypothetical protein